jgi:hypothetical protein
MGCQAPKGLHTQIAILEVDGLAIVAPPEKEGWRVRPGHLPPKVPKALEFGQGCKGPGDHILEPDNI